MKRFFPFIGAVVTLAIVIVVAGWTRVPPDHALLVRSRLGGEPKVLAQGNRWAFPLFHEKHLYPLGPQSDTLRFEIGAFLTQESEPVGLDVVVGYELTAESLPSIHRSTRGRYRQQLRSAVSEIARPVIEGRDTFELFRGGPSGLAGPIRDGAARAASLLPYGTSSLEVARLSLDPGTERELARSLARRLPPTGRIVIVGVDGADWDIIDPMIREGGLPNFARLIERGTRASLESIQPMLSPRIWTSIATGKSPEEHGITDFLIKDRTSGRLMPITSNLRRSKALWNILSDLEIPVGFVGWLATWPAEEVHGFMVSDRMAYYAFNPDRAVDTSPRKTYPDPLFESLRPMVVDQTDLRYADIRRFLDLSRDEFDRRTASRYDPEDPIQNFCLIYATTETYRKIGLRQLRQPVRLFGLYFELIDAVSHLFVRHMPPHLEGVSEQDCERFRNAVFETYRRQDEILGEILEALDEETIVICLSDHGFRTGAERLIENAVGSPLAMLRVGHGGRAGRAVLDHAPLGILLLSGPGIRSGATIDEASVMDIAPTVLHLLGLPVPRDMSGRVLAEALESEFAQTSPVVEIASYETGDAKRQELPIASPEDEALLERLAALGYVDRGTADRATEAQHRPRETRRADAFVALKEALKADPNSATLWANLGFAHLAGGELDEAQEALERALELNPDLAPALSNLAVVLTRKGRYEEAARALERAVGLVPENAELHDNLGVLYVHLGRPDEARRQFQRASELEPRMPEPYNNLGAVALKVKDYEEARAQFEKALRLSPGFPEAHLNLGRLAFETGDATEALLHLERVLQIDPEHAEGHYRAGLAYQRLGEREKARKAWQEAGRMDPRGEIGQEARRLLEE